MQIMEDQSYSTKYAYNIHDDMNSHRPQEEIMATESHSVHYLVNGDDEVMPTEADIDQIAAENLIFMARDGQEIIRATGTDENGAVVVSASDGTQSNIDCAALLRNIPQMVTEEVITDDWVQRQGEERVEIAAEQIIGSSSQIMLEMEVPLPTVQDEYTALRPYPCDFCSRRFRKKATLMNHMVAHQSDRPHLCKLCGSRFFRRSDLINHLKAHAEVPDQEYDDVDFLNLVEQQQRRPANDHFYEHDWSEPEPMPVVAENKSQPIDSNTSFSSSLRTTAARGRISRLKPKKDVYAINDVMPARRTEKTQSNPADLEYVEASTASVKLTEDSSTVLQQIQYPVIDDSKPFVCQECGLAFAREKALSSHLKNHRNEAPYECNQCNEMFSDTTSLHEHQKTHQFEESNSEYDPAEADATQSESESEQLYGEFFCNQCGMSFHRQDLLRRHEKTHLKTLASNGDIDDDPHCCNTCGETFAEALDLLAHAEIHARFAPFKCLLCGESFFEEQNIKNHLISVHSDEMGPNSCILCGKMCRDRKALIKHAWDHSREKSHTCSKCGKNFHNKARLKRHMTSHRDKSVICTICNEEFPDGRTLSNHRHSHSAASSGKLFPCNECGKTFGSRSSQQIHVRIHTGERPYGCRYCWKAFADGGTLRKHERIHTGEKPYACAVCPRAFNQRVVLREHIRSHHSSMDPKHGTFFCMVCSEELSTANDLIQHLIKHSDMNTAMKRQPVTGPRKYKRRRKLKPHEILHRRHHNQQNGVETDLDLSDFVDMENVDDLLGITETAINSNPHASSTKNTKRKNQTEKSNSKQLTTAGGRNTATYSDDDNNDSEGSIQVTSDQHFNSHNIEEEKLWQTKLINTSSNEETYKMLLSNLENTLQNIDTLVVSNNNNSDSNKNGVDQIESATAQRTQQISKSETKYPLDAKLASARTRKKPDKNVKISRPRMIHTEKWTTNSAQSGNKRRSKTFITTHTDRAHLELLPKSMSLVHDYEIISPDTQPPNQISSSPQYIKQEQYQQHHNNKHHNIDQQQFNAGPQGQRSVDLYDAQLLLETSTLRKEAYEKFNPSIVNDLEEILRSPDKSVRQRFTSESSNQFLVEEQHHMIKIEPTSPDLREIVQQSSSASVGVSDARDQRRSTRATRSSNRKYLDFEPSNTVTKNGGGTTHSSKRNAANTSRSPNYKIEKKTPSKSGTESFDAYIADSNKNNNHLVPSSSDAPTFSLISPTVQIPERKPRYFECEMCSAVFSDRAQLLGHVPVHI